MLLNINDVPFFYGRYFERQRHCKEQALKIKHDATDNYL